MTSLFDEISELPTEKNNIETQRIDEVSIIEMLEIINSEDKKVALAVQNELPEIAKAVEFIAQSFQQNGRLIYIGAGTSGRLGIVDASECPPTFGTDPSQVQAIIAGGIPAIFRAQEGVEDSELEGANSLIELKITKNDVICGIAASGRTPFVLGALRKAQECGARTVLITTSSRQLVLAKVPFVDVIICPDVGPEVIAGSTRMKSGTAQKMVLNMLTTGAMIAVGKTYGNIMVDVQLSNNKLRERAIKILIDILKISYTESELLLEQANGHVKTAIIMGKLKCNVEQATTILLMSNGFVKRAINNYQLM